MVSKIEEQRKMKDARRRALIIDDELDRIYAGAKLFGQDARGILIREREDPLVQKMYLENFGFFLDMGLEETIKRVLSEEQYRVILLDGNLGMNLEGEHFDGAVVAKKLRRSEYGSKNLWTPILSTSSQDRVIPLAEGSFSLRYSEEYDKQFKEHAQALLKRYN